MKGCVSRLVFPSDPKQWLKLYLFATHSSHLFEEPPKH